MKPTVLVIDDQMDVRLSARLVLNNYQYDVIEAESPQQALELLEVESKIKLILLDMNYSNDTTSGEEGLRFLKILNKKGYDIPIVIMTAWASIELAVEAMQLGAGDFIEKPWKNQRLIQIVKQQLQLQGIKTENKKFKQQQKDELQPQPLVWQAPIMVDAIKKIERLARSDATIFLLGENGTGKSSIARFIHQQSNRSLQNFISVNMGAIPESLFESEMFGHTKGAFTDAKEDRIGRFELAENGTLFLDEIANIPLSQQGKLLRVLEEGDFERVGSSKSQKANVRLICATNADIATMIEQGQFRADLYFRLNTLQVTIPELKHRKEDILPLANHFLAKFSMKYGLEKLELSDSAVIRLQKYNWPGNVRELGHILERAVLLSDSEILSETDIELENIPALSLTKNEDSIQEIPLLPLKEMEQKMVEKALQYYNGNVHDASISLGITESALYRRIDKFQINKRYVSEE